MKQEKDRQRRCVVIPVRGGSKGIPRKNLQLLDGKPLLVHPIEAALNASAIPNDHIWVSTDDDELASVAHVTGARVLRQPPEISGDTHGDILVMKHFIKKCQVDYDYIVHLRATFPHITGEIIDHAVQQFEMAYDGYDSLRSVIRADQIPWKMWFMSLNGYLEPAIQGNTAAHSMPRQLLRQAYWQNAAVDIVKTWVIKEFGSMTGDRIMPFVMDSTYDADIDTLGDLARARASHE